MATIKKLQGSKVGKSKSARFEVNAALFEELGERLVSKPEIALAELIKNSYDADAGICTIALSKSEVSLEDNGHGMTEQEFLKNWMVVSTQEKGVARFSRTYARSMAGSKGVGRFSARFLGHALDLTTVAYDPKLRKNTELIATFDWRAMSREKNISTVKISYSVRELPPTANSKTVLRIYQLRNEAKRISLAKIKTDVLKLTDPMAGLEPPPFLHAKGRHPGLAADPGFSLIVGDVDTPDSEKTGPAPSIQAEILKRYMGRVRVQVVDDTLTYQVFWRDTEKALVDKSISLTAICGNYTSSALEVTDPARRKDARGLPIEVRDIQHLPVAERLNSPVFIDARFFPGRPGTFSNMGVDGRVAQSWVRDSASVAIVDNNFPMSAYADEASDWLALNANKASNERNWQSIFMSLYPMDPLDKKDPARNPMLALPSGKMLIGRVHIATSKPPASIDRKEIEENWLQPNMDRESLRSNDAFRLLWHISRFAAELVAHFDRKLRLEEEERAQKQALKAAKSGLTKAIAEIQASKEIVPAARRKIVDQLQAVQLRFTEAADYEKEARMSLELMSMMGVMAGFMTHEFEKAVSSLQKVIRELKALSKLDPKFGAAAERISTTETALAHYMDYMRLFVDRARNPKAQQFKANAQVVHVVETMRVTAAAHKIEIKVDIDSRLPGPHIPLAAYHGIVINLLSNAMKALVPKISDEPRVIRIHATNDANRHTLVCADNGIGIPEYLRPRIWDPLFTTTADEENPLGSGLGLGLSVISRVVKQLRGTIELMETPPPSFVTAFRLSLPMQPSS